MKKIIIASLVLVAFSAVKVSAQNLATLNLSSTSGKASVNLKAGENTILLKASGGSSGGAFVFTVSRSGDSFSNVIFKDAAGTVTRLQPVPAGTQGAPKPECKSKLPDACFSSPDKSIGLCMCKPGDLSTGGENWRVIATYDVKILKK